MKRTTSRLLPLAVILCLFLTSCLGVNIGTSFNGDGSGTLTMKLRISQALLQMGDEQGNSPIPVTKQELEASYKDLPGVKVESVTQASSGDDRVITAVISFKDFSVFKNSKDLAGADASLTVDAAGTTTYSVAIGVPGGEGLSSAVSQTSAGEAGSDQNDTPDSDQAVTQAFKGLMDGYALEYSVTAPRKIISHTLGDVTSDGKTVSYSIAMSDYVELADPPTFKVVW